MKLAKQIASWLLTALMCVALALAALVVVVPRVVGAVPLTVLTGSMRPGIQPGDLIVSRPVDPNSLRIGQIITFQPVSGGSHINITHRIVNLTRNLDGEVVSVLTRGDANTGDDAPLVPEQVMGRLMYRIPRVGYLTNNTNSALQLGMVVGVALIGYALITFFRPEKAPDDDEAAVLAESHRYAPDDDDVDLEAQHLELEHHLELDQRLEFQNDFNSVNLPNPVPIAEELEYV